jgi:hypothetical protein
MTARPPITPFRGAATYVKVGGTPVTALFGPMLGGVIVNPLTSADQRVDPEYLYVDITGPAALEETITTTPIAPGEAFYVVPGQTTNVSINAATSGHRFAAIVYQPQVPFPPTPQPGTFPPTEPTSLTGIIPSYLYEEYDDDDDLQAFVAAWNSLAQGYLDWFVDTPLAVYTSPAIAGPLLDLVGTNLYGMRRPALSSGKNRDIGPINTYPPNTMTPNSRKNVGPSNVTIATDDVYKRCITWNFYKGDGNVFNTRWLKRRVMRFLIGVNGTAPNIDQTYLISVTYAPNAVSIKVTQGTRTITGGAFPNRTLCNKLTPNALSSFFTPGPTPFALGNVLQEAMQSGVLQMPFQYTVHIAA